MNSPSQVTVFRATAEHQEFARQAIEECHGRGVPDERALREFLEDSDCYLIVAVLDERVVGSLNGYRLRNPHRAAPQFLLYEIDVVEQHRQRGIGRTLVDAFTEEARAAGAAEEWVITDESNKPAMALYHRCGYRRVNNDDVMLERTV